MDIIHPDKHTFSLIRDFLEPYEEKCVLLCSHVRKEDENIFVIIDSSTVQKSTFNGGDFITTNGNSVTSPVFLGVLRIDSTLFHYIPEENLPILEKNANFINITISKILGHKKIRCISGEAKGTDFFIRLLGLVSYKPYQVNNYNLMILNKLLPSAAPSPLENDDQVARFTINNLDEMLSVQKRYLQDEVAPQGKKVSDLEAKMSLRQILKNQLCLVIVSGGDIAAKANTNAIGLKWVQIGGVYTNPIFRRNGYAYYLVYRICARALKVGRNVALFVKEKNIPAQKLYKKLGFIEKGKYKIGYF